MMRYDILHDTMIERLERRVAEALSFGWEAQGGVSIAFMGGTLNLAQAMVKRGDDLPFNPMGN